MAEMAAAGVVVVAVAVGVDAFGQDADVLGREVFGAVAATEGTLLPAEYADPLLNVGQETAQ